MPRSEATVESSTGSNNPQLGGDYKDGWDITDARNFWGVVDTGELSRDEIALVARYFVDSYRSRGYTILADKFLREAGIDDTEKLEGDLCAYTANWCKDKPNPGTIVWIYFCRDMLRLHKHKETTKREQQPVDDDKVSKRRRDAFWTIIRYIALYHERNTDWRDEDERKRLAEAGRRYKELHLGSRSEST